MPIGAIAGAAVAGVGAFLQYKAQQQANQISYANLQHQKDVARKQHKLATAPRTDVYGNELEYVPGLGWRYKLTPQTEAITKAQQREQLLQLTEDAKRNREFRERQDEMSKVAGEEYDKALTDYRYGLRPSEEDIQGDFTRLMRLNRDKGLNEVKGVLSRQALRLGRGGDIQKILRTADDQFADSFARDMLQGQLQGSQEYRRQKEFVENDLATDLDRFSAMANKFDPAQISRDRTPERLGGLQGEMQKAIANALESDAYNTGNAYSQLAQGAAQAYPRLGGVSSALSRIGGGSGGRPSTFNASVVEPTGGLPMGRNVGNTGFLSGGGGGYNPFDAFGYYGG